MRKAAMRSIVAVLVRTATQLRRSVSTVVRRRAPVACYVRRERFFGLVPQAVTN